MATVIAKTELAGTVYLVTGSSRGIGLEFVTQLLNRGAKVIAGARSPGSSEGLQDLLKEFSDLLFTVPLDVSIEDSIKVISCIFSVKVIDAEIEKLCAP